MIRPLRRQARRLRPIGGGIGRRPVPRRYTHRSNLRCGRSCLKPATQLAQFMHLAWEDRNAGTAVVYGHLVDGSECLELAALHLDMLRTAVGHRLRIEDDLNGADLPF